MKMVRVGDICEQIRGVSYAKSEATDQPVPGSEPILRANSVTDHGLLWHDLVYVPSHRISTKQRLQVNDVVVAASSGSLSVVGKAAQVLGHAEGSFGAFCKVLRPGPEVDPHYFGHFFRTEGYRRTVSRLAAGANINNLKNEHLDDLEFPLPSPSTQRHIAAILNAADALRVKRRATIEKLDVLMQSTFLEMFGDPATNPKGWPVGVVGDLLAAVNYGTSKKPHDTDGAFPVLRMNNITYQGGWDFSSLKYVDLTPAEEPKYLVHEGQLLFNRTNSKELVGKTAVYRRATPVAFAGYLVRAIVSEHAHCEYVGAFMNTAHTKAYLRNRCKNIIGMANINAQEFKAIPVPKPPVDLQRRFAGIVASIERQRSHLLEQLAELDKLFASLQSRAFSGELCPSSVS